jgi:hypothetical protein
VTEQKIHGRNYNVIVAEMNTQVVYRISVATLNKTEKERGWGLEPDVTLNPWERGS